MESTRHDRTPEDRARMIGHLAAKTREELEDLVEFAWAVIANAGYGNWTRESTDWQYAAHKWGVLSGFRSEDVGGTARVSGSQLCGCNEPWCPVCGMGA